MNLRYKSIRILCMLASVCFSLESASALEIFVSGRDIANTPVFGKLTITGSDVAYSQIGTFASFQINLARRDTSTFYSINSSNNNLVVIDAGGNITAAIGATDSYLGMATIGSTLYGANSTTDPDSFGSINTTNASYSGIGNLGITLGGNFGRMADLGSTIYLTNGAGSSSTFGTVNTGTGAYSTIATGSNYDSLLIVGDGSTLYGINSSSLLVSTINVGSGVLTPLNATTGSNLPTQLFGAVPEPSTYILAGVATCILAIAGKRKLRGRSSKTTAS